MAVDDLWNLWKKILAIRSARMNPRFPLSHKPPSVKETLMRISGKNVKEVRFGKIDHHSK